MNLVVHPYIFILLPDIDYAQDAIPAKHQVAVVMEGQSLQLAIKVFAHCRQSSPAVEYFDDSVGRTGECVLVDLDDFGDPIVLNKLLGYLVGVEIEHPNPTFLKARHNRVLPEDINRADLPSGLREARIQGKLKIVIVGYHFLHRHPPKFEGVFCVAQKCIHVVMCIRYQGLNVYDVVVVGLKHTLASGF